MKVCRFCGNEVHSDDSFCEKCGCELDKDSFVPVVAPIVNKEIEKKDNIAAIVGFVCALASWVTCGALTIPGFILSVWGYAQKKYCNPERESLAILGIVFSSIILLIPLILLILYFVFGVAVFGISANDYNNWRY